MAENAPPSAAAGPTAEWVLWNPRRQESRTFIQGALSIEGEARLIGLSRRLGAVLGDADYTFGQLGELFEEGSTDWAKVLTLVEKVSVSAPDLIADAVTVLLGIFPTNEDGSPNPEFEPTKLFLRGAVNIARVNDMFQMFIYQNEYSRLLAPFAKALSEAMDAYATPKIASDSSDPSAPLAIVGGDGSRVELEPDSIRSTSTTEPPAKETKTPSARSRSSSKRATARRTASGAG